MLAATYQIQRGQVQAADRSIHRARLYQHVRPLVVISLLYAFLFFHHVGSLGFHADEWFDLHLAAFYPLNQLAHTWPLDYRPFDLLPWIIGVHLFGASLAWYVAAYSALLWATALVLYAVVYQLTRQPFLALGAATIWAVYPADAATPWLSTACYRAGAFFLLLAILCLLTGRHVTWRRYIVALVCTGCCLGSQELFLGLLLFVPAIVVVRAPRTDMMTRALYALPFASLIVLYLMYRLWLGPHVLHYYDVKGGQYDTSVSHVLGIIATMLLVVGPEAWQLVFGGLGMPLGSPVTVAWMVGTGVVLVVTALSVVHIARHMEPHKRLKASSQAIRPGLVLVGVGLLGVCGGILPLLPTTFQPVVFGIDTRVNAAADIGAACVIAGLIWIATHAIPVMERRASLLFLAVATFAVLPATLRFERVADLNASDWSDQRVFLQQLLARAPGVKQHTYVIVVGADQGALKALWGIRSWGMDNALSLLYPNTNVHGTVAWDGGTPPSCIPSAIPKTGVLIVRYATVPHRTVTPLQGSVVTDPRACSATSDTDRITMRPTVSRWRQVVEAELAP